MNGTEMFHSPLARMMADFVAFKRMQGYDYCAQAECLSRFDRFLSARSCTDSDALLSAAMFSEYLATTAALAPSTREGRLSVVRQFSKYLHAHRPASGIMPKAMLPRHSLQRRFCRISPEQVRDLMDAALNLRPKRRVRRHCIRFLIGLLYCSGLRISEALKLNLGDVDCEQATLLVRRGKFGKDRLVALNQGCAEALNMWIERRWRQGSTAPKAPLLLGRYNSRLTYRQASYAFRTLCRNCAVQGPRRPRLHDLRHNFACRCIELWRRQGKDVQALLPVLATAMGHVNIFATQIYIHIEAHDLQEASSKFWSRLAEQRRGE